MPVAVAAVGRLIHVHTAPGRLQTLQRMYRRFQSVGDGGVDAYVSVRQHTSAYAAEDVAEIPKIRSVGDGGVAELPVCVCVAVFRF